VSPLPPSTPRFGDALPVEASPETLRFLGRRRSASALALAGPGPDDDQLRALLTVATRAPDHGKLAPWRFILLRGAAKAAFVEALGAIALGRPDAAKAQAKLGKIRTPPVTIAVISRSIAAEIPPWEQELSAGAVCTLLIVAAQAMGFGANWITDWYAYDAAAIRLLGLNPGEKVAGFVHLGTAVDAPLERVRPDLESLVSAWVVPDRDQRPR
jgi:nitroreductase